MHRPTHEKTTKKQKGEKMTNCDYCQKPNPTTKYMGKHLHKKCKRKIRKQAKKLLGG